MADFRKMIPLVLHQEEGLPVGKLGLPIEQLYAEACKGGVHIDPRDSGGPTMCGVTLSTYASYRRKRGLGTSVADLERMPFKDWMSILKGMFWDRWQGDKIKTEVIAITLVDWLWTSGRYGITNVQKLLGVVVDGIVGPKTIAALNGYGDQHELFWRIQEVRKAYYKAISEPGSKNAVYRKGWMNRVSKITWDGIDYGAKWDGK